MEAAVKKQYSRLPALLMIGIGAIFSYIAFNVYTTGQSFDTRLLFIVPMGWLYGIAGLIEPRLLLAWNDKSIEGKFKGISFAVFPLVVIGFVVLRYVIFKGWH